MKKVFTILAAISMMALSCNKETPVSENGSIPASGKLTATIVPTKVAYAETSEMNLQPSWEVGDEIIGFDDNGNTYTLSVASVSAETATLEGTVPDGALHLIYKSGAKASDIANKTLAIDYTSQAGDKTMPAVMLADGTVEDGACDFTFTNAGAIIGISAVKGAPSGAAISKITVEGSNLSAATVALSGSALTLTAATVATDAISTAALSGITVTDSNGTLSSPIFIAVPAGAVIAKVSASVAKDSETMKKPSATPQEGVDYVTIGGVKWAKWNVGANSEKDRGLYFPWAGTEGYVRYGQTWQKAQATYAEFSYSPSPAKTVSAGNYLYVNVNTTQPFTGHLFNWINTPYQTQDVTSNYSTKFTKYLGSTNSTYKDPSATDADALKIVLDPDDDAAHVNWGGNWCIPSQYEFLLLCQACGVSTSTQYQMQQLTSATPAKGIYSLPSGQNYLPEYSGVSGILFCDGTNKLFFPVTGIVSNNTISAWDSSGYYWLNWWDNSKNDTQFLPLNAYLLSFSSTYLNSYKSNNLRMYGQPVRPILK